MKSTKTLIAMLSLLSLSVAVESFAQRGMQKGKGSGGWGMGNQYDRMYDPKTVETLSGEVVTVDKFTPIRGMSSGVHLTLKTKKDTIAVHLGPEWYLENQDIEITPRDKIEIKGSRITFESKPAIIAAQVKKGDETLKLRDESGFPVWRGWRRR